MSDYEIIKKMLDGKVKYQDRPASSCYLEYYNSNKAEKVIEGRELEIQNGQFGYTDFVTIWLFDKDGKFLTLGNYE